MNILILNGPDEGKLIKLIPGKYTIGRSPDCDIVLEDQYVSSMHAELSVLEDNAVSLRDSGSRNGTYLLGELVESPVKVQPGDIFRTGRTFLKVSRRSMERFMSPDDVATGSPEAIIVVDIVGSSKIAQALGDRVASKVKSELYLNLQSCLAMFPAEFVKNTGDGYMMIFTGVMDAIRFSIELMKTTRGDGTYKGYHIRIGIHYGETFRLPDNDRRGLAVDMAFRVESVKPENMHQTVVGIKKGDLPRVDRIFISEVVQNLIPSHSSIKTRCIGYFDLKGFTGRHKIFEVVY